MKDLFLFIRKHIVIIISISLSLAGLISITLILFNIEKVSLFDGINIFNFGGTIQVSKSDRTKLDEIISLDDTLSINKKITDN